MKRIWIFLINTFLVSTEGSYRLAVRISTKHDAALQAAAAGLDPFFVAMYTYFHPLHVALVNAYNAWVAQGGSQEGQSLTLTQLLRLLSSTKAEAWMVGVKQFYAQTTARFKAIFPDLKKVFQTGGQTTKMAGVSAISIAIGSDPLLSVVKSDIDAFNGQLIAANTAQKGSISVTGTLSAAVETARVNNCIGQLADYGGLIQKYAATPEVVGNYFDEAALRGGAQILFHHSVKKETVYTIAKHTSLPTDEYLLENDGTGSLVFGFVFKKGNKPTAIAVTVGPLSALHATGAELSGDLTNDKILVCYNPDATLDGEFTVEFL